MSEQQGKHEDFLTCSVPSGARRSAILVLFVWLGFLIVVGIMAVGGGLAAQLTLRELILALVIGNAMLAAFAGLGGYIGGESGLSFNLLVSRAFPGASWRFVSLYVPTVLIGWYGVEASIFANLIGELTGASELVRRALMAVAGIVFAVSAYIGFRALRVVSLVLVPVIIILGSVAIWHVAGSSATGFDSSDTSLNLSTAISIVVGTWIMGALTCVPDLTRFCRSGVRGAAVGVAGIVIGNVFTLAIGAAGAALTQESDPAKILASLGFPIAAIAISLANIWTTNDNNMYSASLNIARMLSMSRRQAVLVCMLVGAMFAALDPSRLGFLFPFLLFLGNTAPALGGVVLGAYGMRQWLRWKKQSVVGAWAGWVGGSLFAYFVPDPWTVVAGFVGGVFLWALFSAFGTAQQADGFLADDETR